MSGALGVICARGGSKGLPGKNLLPLGGAPLVAWSVKAARASRRLSRTIISTDDLSIADAARMAGCEVPFLRPAHLATDEATLDAVLIHALDALGQDFDYVVTLQATSPFRTGADIDACIELCKRTGATTALSVCKAPKPPQWLYSLSAEQTLVPFFPEQDAGQRRQEFKDAYVPNGAVYVAACQHFRKNRRFREVETKALIMPAERSVDIDARLDYVLAQAILAAGLVSFQE